MERLGVDTIAGGSKTEAPMIPAAYQFSANGRASTSKDQAERGC